MKWCNLNPNRSKNKNCDCKRNFGGWNKGKSKSNDERIKKQSESLKESWKNGVYDNVIYDSFKGKHHSKETKAILRQKRIEYLKNNFEKNSLEQKEIYLWRRSFA